MKEPDCRQLRSRLDDEQHNPLAEFTLEPPTIDEIVGATDFVLRSPGVRQLAGQLHLNETDMDDIHQETLFKAGRARDRYSPAYHLRTWIGRIARNAVLDLYRKQRRRRCSSLTGKDGELLDPVAPTREPVQELIDRDTMMLLAEALQKANPLVRQIAALRQEGLSFVEIAQRVGRSHPAVVSIWHRFKVCMLTNLEK